MSRLTLRLPNSLHRRLEALAKQENVSLNQYIVYTLTQQVAQAYTVHELPDEDLKRQEESFVRLLSQLHKGGAEDIHRALDGREEGEPDPIMKRPEVRQLQARIQERLAPPHIAERP